MLQRWRLERVVAVRQPLRQDVYALAKAVILALVAVQLARLVWALVSPLGPVGTWVPAGPQPLSPGAQVALLTSYDPFAGVRPAAPQAGLADVSGYKLFGTRMAVGGMPASAIIAGPDGVQASFNAGEQVAPGVRLATVTFDYVTLSTGSGQEARLAMDDPATQGTSGAAAPVAASASSPSPQAGAGLTAEVIRRDLAFAPRVVGGRVTGLLVSPLGNEATLQAAGLRSGDVIVAINNRRIAGVADAAALQTQLTPGARLSLSVERGASVVPVALLLAGPQ